MEAYTAQDHNWYSVHFDQTASNDLSRANQIDMTGPNSVVSFAQTRVFRYVTVLYHVILPIDIFYWLSHIVVQ